MNKPFVKTNVLAYQLNSLALQQQWQLLKITVPKAEWQEYRKLRAMVSPDAVTCMQQVGEDKVYLWLVSKMIKVPNNSKLAISKVLFHRLHEDNISHSLILQLLMNRHNILKATGPMPNSASELLLVTDQMPHPDQSVVLAAEVTRSNELVMRVKTYTGTTKALQSEDVQIDWSRQLMVPHQGEQQVDRYRFGNRTNKHNTVGFADLVDENELAQTKIHFAWTLLNKMREYDAQYFRQLPTFVASELMLLKLESQE